MIGLLKDAEMDVSYSPHDFGNMALVAENHKGIVGFVWGICGNSPIVHLNDFVVDKRFWYKKMKNPDEHPAPKLLATFFGLLKRKGYKRWISPIEIERKKAFKLAKKVGGQDFGKCHLMGGSIDELIDKIQTI